MMKAKRNLEMKKYKNVTIPSGTNGVSAGTTKISSGYTVTVKGEWRII